MYSGKVINKIAMFSHFSEVSKEDLEKNYGVIQFPTRLMKGNCVMRLSNPKTVQLTGEHINRLQVSDDNDVILLKCEVSWNPTKKDNLLIFS